MIAASVVVSENPAHGFAAARMVAVPGPWAFEKHVYGLAHCLIDRDGRVIGSHLALPNGPLMAAAPAMAALLRELVAGG